MLINVTDLAEAAAEGSEKLISGIDVPAVIIDENLIIRHKNRAAAEQIPFLRKGASVGRFIAPSECERIRTLAPGRVAGVGLRGGIACNAIAAKGRGVTFLLFNTVSSELCDCVLEAYSAISGYDQQLTSASASRLLNSAGRRPDRIATRAARHLADMMRIIIGGASKEDMRPFDAVGTLRGIMSALEGLAADPKVGFVGSSLPREITVFGSERSFAAALAVAASDLAAASVDNRLEFSGNVEDGIARFRVSAITSLEPDYCEYISRERMTRADFVKDSRGLTPDVYLMRMLASGSMWELKTEHSRAPHGERLSFVIRCALADVTAFAKFELSDSLPLYLLALVSAEFSDI